MATARQTAINSNPIVTPRRILHPRKSAAASEIRSSAQTKAKKPKNHLLYKNFRIRASDGGAFRFRARCHCPAFTMYCKR
jgi:hypothetical protein